jgi:hypothetical protein
MVASTEPAGRRSLARRYPPLLSVLVAAGLLFTLPSALTQPQNNPSTTLELAPVPPSDVKVAPQQSNGDAFNAAVSDKGLGNGNGPGSGPGAGPGAGSRPGATAPGPGGPSGPAPGGPGAPPALVKGAAKPPQVNRKCVEGRQASDPLAPPCVDHYEGNNGGATYQGVTADEVKVIIYFDPYGTLNTARGEDQPPYNKIIDLDAPSTPNEIAQVFVNRNWEHYFDTTYQDYNRHVHMYVQFGSYNAQGVTTPSTQAADAAYGYTSVRPFAVINYSAFGNGAFYNTYMAQHGVLIFGSTTGRSESFYRQFPGQQWGYFAPLERSAAQYSEFVCSTLYGKPADYQGTSSPPIDGSKRKFGMIYTTDPAAAGLQDEAKTVLSQIKAKCGLTIDSADLITYSRNGYSVDAKASNQQYAVDGMTKLKSDGVTTVLWPAGYEVKFGTAATNLQYSPEVVVGDDDLQYSTANTQVQDQTFYSHAFVVASTTLLPVAAQTLCFQYYRTVDPAAADSDVISFACPEYNDLRQLFIGIQVAGPNLAPASIDRGFHAIPQTRSTNPQVPSCFYLPGDYTCVKDSVIEHWDPAGQDPNNRQKGCWRMVANGTRYLPGTFPKDNLSVLAKPDDVCNGFNNLLHLSTSPT